MKLPIKDRDEDVVGYTEVSEQDVEAVKALGTLRFDGKGYVIVNIKHPVFKDRYYTLGLHRFIVGLQYGDKRQVDHKNHDILDNQRTNLVVATHSQNQQNRKITSKFVNINKSKERERKNWACWYGCKTIKGKIYRTSYFYNPVLAKKELEKILP